MSILQFLSYELRLCERGLNSRLLRRHFRDIVLPRYTVTEITLSRIAVALAAIL